VVLVLQRILPKLDELREIFFKNPNFGILFCKMLLVWKLQKFLKKRKLFYYLKWQRFFSRHIVYFIISFRANEPNSTIYLFFLFFTKNLYDKIFLISDYKTRPPRLNFEIFNTSESFVLMPKKLKI